MVRDTFLQCREVLVGNRYISVVSRGINSILDTFLQNREVLVGNRYISAASLGISR
jgi:hypothetical protein